jgi:8-oxo-dGTP diphosphatase
MEIKDKELHRIAITAIIYNDEGKYLITQRAPHKKVHANRWTVPGGGLSTDDYINEPAFHNQWYYSLTKALKREVKEETGIEIEEPEYLLDLTFIRPDGIPILVLSYFAKYKTGEIKFDEDTIDAKWIMPDELKNFDLIEGIEDEIKKTDEILKNRKAG